MVEEVDLMPEKDLILKINKPDCSELDMVSYMDVKLLTERDYYKFQAIFSIDMKTSSWLFTPENIRKKHETLFGNSIMVGFRLSLWR